MSLPNYRKYKIVDADGLDVLPFHWGAIPLKYLATVDNSGSYGVDEADAPNSIPVATTAQIDSQGRFNVEEMPIRGFFPDDKARYGCSAGDILIVKSSGSATNIISGKAGLVTESTPFFIFSNFLLRLRPNTGRTDPRYIYYVIISALTRERVKRMCSSTTYPNLQVGEYISALVPAPPLSEQINIVSFLDRETAKIDGLIAEQEKLIALLSEKRQATISHAVTKGLNADAPMKDSGVAWLGEVPVHWKVSPIKFVARVGNGSTPNRDNPNYWENGIYPWLNSSVVNQEAVVMADQFVTARALKECHLPIITPPAVLIGITGQGRTRGMATTLKFEATINQHVAYIQPKDFSQLRIDFLRRVFDMAYVHLRTESESGGSTKGAITCEQISRLAIPLPNMEEQKAIACFLHTESARLDELTAAAAHGIDLLKERRSALISAAVTGKIDVRHLAEQKAA
jgi:type I restriction enzyme, S subunit